MRASYFGKPNVRRPFLNGIGSWFNAWRICGRSTFPLLLITPILSNYFEEDEGVRPLSFAAVVALVYLFPLHLAERWRVVGDVAHGMLELGIVVSGSIN